MVYAMQQMQFRKDAAGVSRILTVVAVTIAAIVIYSMGAAHRAVGAEGPIPVKVVKTADGYTLLRGGKPFFIKGAGGDYSKEVLKECGGNSYRTWGATPAETKLDAAAHLGLGVTVGIWLGHKEQGFSYKDPKQVQQQFDSARETVLRYRNSPALLIWSFGNEMEGYDSGADPDVWRAVEDIARMAKKLDPNHPTMTVVAEINPEKVHAINEFCPDIDIVGINSYAGCPSIPQRYKDAGGVKPYIITEFGPPGTWEWHDHTAWGAIPEMTSTEKADWYRKSYVNGIANQPMCLGSYVFAWGHKQEATATWYGMFLPDGSKLAAVDTMTELWSGKAPAVRAPVINSMKPDGPVSVAPNTDVHVSLDVTDPQADPLKVDWVLQYDAVQYNKGGQTEATPMEFPDAVVNADEHGAEVKMPAYGGGYRLFAYIHNNHNEAAVANVPLFVTGNTPLPTAAATPSALPVVVVGENKNGPWAPSGYEGNTGAISIDETSSDNPHSGSTCLKASYSAPDNWGGVVWQDPPNDWGNVAGGLNLTGARQLTFWARGAQGGEVVSFAMGVLGNAKFKDTAHAELDNVQLNKDWTMYTMDLTGKDLTDVKTAFVWTVQGQGKPVTFYLDDVKYQ